MSTTCQCTNIHKVTSLEATADDVVMSITNSTNLSSLDFFDLVLCVNPNTVVTGAPLPYKILVNGEEVGLYNKYSLPIYTNRLHTRKRYHGAYVSEPDSGSYVILWDTPKCPVYARS